MGGSILPGDSHALGITALLVTALNLVAFGVSYSLQVDSLTDFIGSSSFILCALLSLLAEGAYTQRQIAITALVIVSRLELATFLLHRVMKRGRDERFDTIRVKFASFLGFWWARYVGLVPLRWWGPLLVT